MYAYIYIDTLTRTEINREIRTSETSISTAEKWKNATIKYINKTQKVAFNTKCLVAKYEREKKQREEIKKKKKTSSRRSNVAPCR